MLNGSNDLADLAIDEPSGSERWNPALRGAYRKGYLAARVDSQRGSTPRADRGCRVSTPYAIAAERLCRAVEIAALLEICEDFEDYSSDDCAVGLARFVAERCWTVMLSMRETNQQRAPEARKEEA